MDNQQNPFLPITIISGALIMGILTFGTVVLFLIKDEMTFYKSGDIFIYVAIPALLLCLIVSFNMDKILNTRVSDKASIQEKINAFFSSTIMRLAPLEGVSLMCIVFMLITESYIYLIFVAIAIITFIILWPSKMAFAKKYNLSREEQKEIGLK